MKKESDKKYEFNHPFFMIERKKSKKKQRRNKK